MSRFLLIVVLICALAVTACREQSKEEIFQQGMQFVESGNYQAAVSLFKEALDKDPNYIDARKQLGIAYLETDKPDRAEKEFNKVLLQEPGSQIITLRLAEIYLSTKRPDAAIDLLDDFQKSNPDNPEALRLLAASHAATGDLQAAEDLYRKSLLLRPDDSRTQLGLAGLLFSVGSDDEAHKLVEAVVKQDPENTAAYYLLFRKAASDGNRENAVTALQKLRSISSEDIVAAYMLGMLYLDAGQIDAARQIAAELKARKPNHPTGYRIDGVALYQIGDYEAAIGQLQRSIAGMPDLPGFYFLGLANYRFGQLELALSNFQKALDKSAEHAPSRLMVAQTLLKQGRIDDAANQVKLVIERDAPNANAHNILASAYLMQGEYDLAMEEIETAIRLDPELAQAHLKKGLFNLASGKRQQGEQDLLNAVNAAPEVMNTRLLLAVYQIGQHNYPKAMQTLEQGLTISPDSAVIYNLMAAAQFGQNKPEEALQSLQKAKSLKPDYYTPYFNIANYHVSRKDYQAALDEYQAVLEVNPNHMPALVKSAALHELLARNETAEALYTKAAQAQSPQGILALAYFQKRNGQKDAFLQTLKDGYTTIPDNPDLVIAYGEALRAAGQYDEAAKIYVELEEARSGLGRPLLLATHLQKGDLAAAREIAERTIAENPSSPQGYLFESAIHEQRSEWQLAEEALQRGIAAAEADTALKMNLGRLQNRQGATDQALKTYDDILRDNPNHVPAIFSKAAIYDAAGNKKQAQDLYEKILGVDENYAPALNNLAYLLLDVYADQGRALELAIRAFRAQPNNPGVMDTLGYALLKNGQVEQSVAFLEKAASLLPEQVEIRLHLAQAYQAAGRMDEAVASLSVIKEADVQEDQWREVKALLNEVNQSQ